MSQIVIVSITIGQTFSVSSLGYVNQLVIQYAAGLRWLEIIMPHRLVSFLSRVH